MIHVAWISPNKRESLKSYAKRLFLSVNPKVESSFMRVSFGGMITQEWSKIQRPENLILISTSFTSKEIRRPLRIAGKLGLTGLISSQVALLFSPLLYYFFGVKSRGSKELLKKIIGSTRSAEI